MSELKRSSLSRRKFTCAEELCFLYSLVPQFIHVLLSQRLFVCQPPSPLNWQRQHKSSHAKFGGTAPGCPIKMKDTPRKELRPLASSPRFVHDVEKFYYYCAIALICCIRCHTLTLHHQPVPFEGVVSHFIPGRSPSGLHPIALQPWWESVCLRSLRSGGGGGGGNGGTRGTIPAPPAGIRSAPRCKCIKRTYVNWPKFVLQHECRVKPLRYGCMHACLVKGVQNSTYKCVRG